MHLLYLDDSGSAPNADEDYFVLGGVSLYEAQVHWVTQKLDDIAESIRPSRPHSVEFHASEIFARRSEPWRDMEKDEARGIIKAVLRVLREAYDSARAFACAVHKESYLGCDPVSMAFEDLCSRFDMYLDRLRADGDRQRGLLILDESSQETSLRKMAREFRNLGTRWGVINHLAETPLFVDSQASRPVQIADHLAYAVFRRYNAGDSQYFDVISSEFDSTDGVVHGLGHKTNDTDCMCLACSTRRAGPSS